MDKLHGEIAQLRKNVKAGKQRDFDGIDELDKREENQFRFTFTKRKAAERTRISSPRTRYHQVLVRVPS